MSDLSAGGATAAGRLFMPALRLDLEPANEVRRTAEAAIELGVCGFVLFGGECQEVGRLIDELRQHAGRELRFAADLERGAGQQFRGLSVFPPPAALAAHPDPEAAVRLAAATTGREAFDLGVDLVFAPVLDLDVEARNPIIATRSFGADPETVGLLGRIWIEACRGEGVLPCAKHFPGHGRAIADSHAEVPVVDATREELEADLAPFRAVIDVIRAIMTAHVVYPALAPSEAPLRTGAGRGFEERPDDGPAARAGGAGRPATLEPAILRDLLRGEMGFQGMVASDALNMAGVAAGAGRGSGSGAAEVPVTVAALRAGCDLLLYPPDLAAGIDAIERAAAADPEVEALVSRAASNIHAAFADLPVGGADRARDTDPAHDPDAGAAIDIIDISEAEGLARATIVTVGAAPEDTLDPARPVEIGALWDDRVVEGRAPFGTCFEGALRDAGWEVRGPRKARDAAREPERATGPAQRILLVAATPQAWKGTAALTGEGKAALEREVAIGRPDYLILFGHRRLLERLSEELRVPGACAWGSEEAMERAAGAWLAGRVGGA